MKRALDVVDVRSGVDAAPEDLLSVSIHLGVVPRSSMTDDLPRAEDLSGYKQVLHGDLVVNRMRAFQGAVGLAHIEGLVSPDYLVLRPRAGHDARFLHHLLRSSWFVGQMVARLRGIGSTSQGNVRTPRINSEDLGEIAAPPLTYGEQRAIADYLDAETARIDALITKKRRMIDTIGERFWSFVDHLLDFESNVPRFKLSWLASTRCDGPFGSSLTSSHYVDQGARVVRLGNLGRGQFKDADQAYISDEHYRTLQRHQVREGDLLVAGLGDAKRPLARACVAPSLGAAIVKADCFRFRLNREADPQFVAWYLSSPSAVATTALLAQGSTRQRVNLGIVSDMHVPLPSFDRQIDLTARIDDELNRSRAIGAALEKQVGLLGERRQALITAAVTGELEIPRVAA
jgi:type I restriction enzyme S subunit